MSYVFLLRFDQRNSDLHGMPLIGNDLMDNQRLNDHRIQCGRQVVRKQRVSHQPEHWTVGSETRAGRHPVGSCTTATAALTSANGRPFAGPFATGAFAEHYHDAIAREQELGRLVAVPNRHQALCAPIDNGDSLAALGLLVHAARGMFRDGPGSISPYAYWVRAGHWERLDVDLTEQGVGVEGPEVFIETVLRRLLE